MLLKDVHDDIERYLENDCYCPGEIYDVSGFFFQVFRADEECKELYRGVDFRYPDEKIITVICRDQLINFWVKEDKIVEAERYDATENNIRVIPFCYCWIPFPLKRNWMNLNRDQRQEILMKS